MIELTTVDAHAGGAPVRLVTGGAPTPRGRTMREKTAWLQRHADHVRRLLMHEPRGHRDMTGAMLTEPVSPGSHAGLVFMHADGYAPMAGHAVLATTMLALNRGLLMPGGDGDTVIYDTMAGTIRARARRPHSQSASSSRVDAVSDAAATSRVAFTNVPSFVLAGGLSVKAGGRTVRVDVAYGGAFYAIVDAESLGVSVSTDFLPLLRQFSREIVEAVEAALVVAHPLDAAVSGVAGTVYTAPPDSGTAHLRGITVLADGAAGRAGSGTGLSAILAVLDAMGLLGEAEEGEPFVFEGMSGARTAGRVVQRTMVGETPAIVPEIEGTAWLIGEHRFVAVPGDPAVPAEAAAPFRAER